MKHLIYYSLLICLGFLPFSKGNSQALVADTMLHFGYFDAVKGMILTNSGDCILAGKMDTDSLTPKNIWVNRLRFVGDTLVVTEWEKYFYPQNASRVSCMKWLQDGNLIIAGSWNNNNMLLKMSPEGDSLTTLLFPSNGDTYFSDVIELSNTDLIVLQVDVDEDLFTRMIRMDSNGEVVWEQDYDDRYYSSLGNYNADSFLVGGYEYHQAYQHIQFGALKPDDGNPYFLNMYQEYYGANNTMEVDSTGIYLGNKKEYVTSPDFVGQVIKVQANGEVDWDVDFTGIGSEVIRDIHVYDDHYILSFSEDDGSVIIGAITFDGVLFSTYIISKPIPQAIAVDTYGDYMYITGRQSNGANGKDVFFMKFYLDSLFTLISGVPEFVLADPVLVYPNPANDRLYVKSTLTSNNGGIQEVRIYNMVGQLKKIVEMDSLPDQYISLRGLEEGLYLVLVQSDNGPPVTKKVLVVH